MNFYEINSEEIAGSDETFLAKIYMLLPVQYS